MTNEGRTKAFLEEICHWFCEQRSLPLHLMRVGTWLFDITISTSAQHSA